MSASSLFSVRLRYHNFVLTNCWAMIVQVSEGSSGNTMCQFLRWSLADENIDMGHACCQRSAKAHDICNNSDWKFRNFRDYANILQKRACSRAPMKLVMPAPPLCEGCMALLD